MSELTANSAQTRIANNTNKKQATSQSGVFLNGRAQVVELLQMLSPNEKKRIINHIRAKNPSLASELTEECVSFEDLGRLSENELTFLLQYISPVVIGMALKGTNAQFQRKILSSIPRQYAEKAFDIMMTPLENERTNIQRAQKKVLEVVIQLRRHKQIEL